MNETVTSAATKVTQSLIATLPPAFIMLVVLNVAFLGLTLWFIKEQGALHAAAIDRVLDVCLEQAKVNSDLLRKAPFQPLNPPT